MISVIIPAYEKEKYIHDCLRSICNQSFSDLEIIIVYRPGKDQTLAEINKVSDSRIRIIEQTQNSGPGGARNLGVEACNGDFFGFVDCDDIIDVDFYKNLYEKITLHKADVAVGEVLQELPCKEKWISQHGREQCLFSFGDKYKTIKNGASFDKLYRTEFIRKHKIRFPEHIYFEDNYWVLAVYYHSKNIVLVKNATYRYKLTEKTNTHLAVLARDIFPAVETMMAFCDEKQFSARELSLIRRKVLITFAGGAVTTFTHAKQMASLIGMDIYIPYILFKKTVKKLLFPILQRGNS